MSERISKKRVEDYLNEGIRYWRAKQLQAQTSSEQIMATHYLDAFQTVRATLIGSALPVE